MNPFQKLVDYIRSSQAELKKVAWPTRRDTIRYSVLVIAVSVITAAFFTVLDTGLHAGVTAMLARKTPARLDVAPDTTTPTPASNTPDTSPVNVNAVTTDGAPTKVDVTPLK